MVAQTIPEDRPLTADEFLLLPMEEHRLYELHQGEVIVPPPPDIEHQRISRRLLLRVNAVVESHQFGEVIYAPAAVVLSEHDVVEPDLFVIERSQQHLVSKRSFNGTPAIVFEILSPSNRRMDLQRKAVLYANAGVAEYWMVDPEKHRVLVQRFTPDGPQTEIISEGAVTSSVLPDFSITIDEIFA